MATTLNITSIPAPRVALIDERTGTISREWYRFLLNLFVLTGSGSNPTSLEDLQVGPPVQEIDLSFIDPTPSGFAAYAAGSSQESQIAEIQKQLEALASSTNVSEVQSELAEVWKQLQALQLVPEVPPGALTTNSSILYGNGSGGFSNVTIGTGVSFTSGTLSATGSGGTVTAVTGTAPVVSSGGTTPVISMAAATTSVNGYLTSTDWTTFNNKQPAGTYVNSVSGTTGRITSTGGVTPVIDLASGIATAGTTGSATLIPVVTIDTYGRVITITTAANPQGTVTSVAALTLGTTGTDLSSTVATGTTTPVITLQVPTASATNRGALSSADWSTFNGKQPAGTYVTSISVSSSNGLAGTSSGGATPTLTLSTSVTGVLKGNGTAISAAVANTDYVPLSTVLTKTADYTITNTDTWIINNKSGSAMTLTFPAASLWPGRSVTVKNLQLQSVNSATSNIAPIDSVTAGTAILLPVIGNWATMVSDGTNWVIMAQAPNNILLLE